MTVTMGILRSQTSRVPATSKDIKMGITRSATDPISEDGSRSSGSGSGSNSGSGSGTNSPRRKTASMDVVRNIRERPSSAIPKYHVLAEQVHRFKMRKCQAMYATAEEQAGIKEMKKWDWKHAAHPGAGALPVGPRNETWSFEGQGSQTVRSEFEQFQDSRSRIV